MSEPSEPRERALPGIPAVAASLKRRTSWLPVVVLSAVFLVGFVPMWFKSSRLAGELFRAQRQLRVEQMQLTLANAALETRQGNYEPARQGMADFFSLVTAELNRGVGSALPAGAPSQIQSLLVQRDDLITLLARGDPAAAERLASAYAAFRKTLGR